MLDNYIYHEKNRTAVASFELCFDGTEFGSSHRTVNHL